MRLVALAAVSALVASLVALIFGGHAFVNYDTAYALLWGGDLASGATPDLEVDLAPTPHPLANVVGMVLEPGGAELLAFLWLAIAGVLVGVLAREWFGVAAGVVAALLFLTREPVMSFGLRAYVDVPYLALVLGALLLEVRRPRSGWPVLALLALAGLLRPEAWLFAAAYVLWLRDWRLLPIAAAAPLLWMLHDGLITGDPLWSLIGTRDNAEELGRKTGPVDLVVYGPRRLGEIAREPVLAGMVAGAWLAYRRRLLTPLVALALALGAFAVLATAGLPIITRYMLLPGALACALAGGAVAEGLRNRAWLPVTGALVVLLVAFAPGQFDRLDRLERSLGIQERILADLDALPAAALRCEPIAVTTRRPIPHLALRFEWIEPRDVEVGAPDEANTYIAPASPEVAERFVFDPRDADQDLPPVPPALRRAAGNGSWTVFSYTTRGGGGCSGAT
jgi:hypothetical protein